MQDARATNLDLDCSSAIACEDKAVQIATAQIQRQAIGSSSQEKVKAEAKSEIPAVPRALKLGVSFAYLGCTQNCFSHRLNMSELTGRGSVASALLIATVIALMVSGGKDV